MQELRDIEKKRAPGKQKQETTDLLSMSQANQKGKGNKDGQTPGEGDEHKNEEDYMVMEVSDHTRHNLIPNCFGVYRPT